MKRINIDIKNDYEFFLELLNGNKDVSEKVIYLEQKPTHTDWLSNTTPVSHETLGDEIFLTIERKKSYYKYGIKLNCRNLTNEPFFRFDPDGPAHRNTIENLPLSEQIVTTPHFNTFDKTGLAIAYKSDILKKGNEAKAIVENIDFGLIHFFRESNINKKSENNVPEIILKSPELFEDDIEIDPLNGIDFII